MKSGNQTAVMERIGSVEARSLFRVMFISRLDSSLMSVSACQCEFMLCVPSDPVQLKLLVKTVIKATMKNMDPCGMRRNKDLPPRPP